MAKQIKKITKKTVKTSSKTVKKAVKSANMITVKNADGDADTTAEILVQNTIKYTPRVSVIVPVYNAADYLIECLDSVTNQTLSEIEIICVNDGSTDDSLKVLQKYANRNSKITIITQNNSGAGIARNCGISVAKGEFIAFMDPDDFYPSNETLKDLYNTAKKNNVDICGGTMNRLKDGEIIIANEYLFDKPGLIKYEDYQFDYGYTRFIYNRKLLQDNNVLFPNYLRQQDPVFFVHAMITAGKFYAVNTPTYIYRVSHDKKPIVWTVRKASDVAKSFRDLLTLSALAHLNRLHNVIAKRICSDWDIQIFSVLVNDKGVVDKSVIEMLHALDYNIIYSVRPDFELPVFYKNLLQIPKFSVIVPVYNTEKWLSQCLDSVINQTLKEIEIICVNDGSTDNSLSILEKYAKKDSRIRIINQKNSGLSVSRNQAMKIASGEYFDFLDSDDYLKPNALEILYTHCKTHNLDMLSFSGNNFQDGSDVLEPNEYWNFSYLPNSIDFKKLTFQACKPFMRRMAVTSCLTVYKRSFIQQNNMTFPEGLCFEDNVFFYKCLTNAKYIGLLNEKLYCRRLHNASITHNRDQHVYDLIKITDLLLEYLKSIKLDKEVFNQITEAYLTTVTRAYQNCSEKEKYTKDYQKLLKKYNASNKSKCFVLFPYYLFMTIWMNTISLPLAKFKRHIKRIMYSHSARGRMDKLVQQIESVRKALYNQIKQTSNQINDINASFNDINSRFDDINSRFDDINSRFDDINSRFDDINSRFDDVNSHFDDTKSKIDAAHERFSILNSEPYWANVYHDTIINSSWLKNKSVSPGRWAVSYIVLYVLYRILDEIKPQSILECGLGQSSKLTIQYADTHNAKLMICEQNSEWLAFFQRQYPTADKYTQILDTEMVHVDPKYESMTYAGFKPAIKNKTFDLVLIDGPFGSRHYSRPEILDVVDNLDKSFVILLDDMNRVGEQETFELLKNKLQQHHIKFVDAIYESDKKLGLICSVDLSWLTTL